MSLKGIIISMFCLGSFCAKGQGLKVESALHYLNTSEEKQPPLVKSKFLETKKLALFCRVDNYFDARSKFPLRLRLGGLEAVNKLEYDTDYREYSDNDQSTK